MAVNQWMNSPSAGLANETDILQDLIDENIAACGVNVQYLPKEQLNLDFLYGESTAAMFKSGFEIEMYISNITQFNGDGDLFNKFDLVANDEATLLVSARRFKVEGKEYDLTVPREEDLIYMPLSNTLWKIRRSKPDEYYFQFGKNYTYRLECGLYQPSHEEFESSTNITPGDLQENDPLVDEVSLNRLLGVETDGSQDEGEKLTDLSSQNIPTQFDVNNPFGGA